MRINRDNFRVEILYAILKINSKIAQLGIGPDQFIDYVRNSTQTILFSQPVATTKVLSGHLGDRSVRRLSVCHSSAPSFIQNPVP